MGIYKRGNLICDDCNQKEKTTDAIIRCILAFHLLFPKERITSEAIYYWCGNVLSQRSIQRVLTNHFTLIKAGRGSYYTLKQKIDS